MEQTQVTGIIHPYHRGQSLDCIPDWTCAVFKGKLLVGNCGRTCLVQITETERPFLIAVIEQRQCLHHLSTVREHRDGLLHPVAVVSSLSCDTIGNCCKSGRHINCKPGAGIASGSNRNGLGPGTLDNTESLACHGIGKREGHLRLDGFIGQVTHLDCKLHAVALTEETRSSRLNHNLPAGYQSPLQTASLQRIRERESLEFPACEQLRGSEPETGHTCGISSEMLEQPRGVHVSTQGDRRQLPCIIIDGRGFSRTQGALRNIRIIHHHEYGFFKHLFRFFRHSHLIHSSTLHHG